MKTFHEAVIECRKRITPCSACGEVKLYRGNQFSVLSVPLDNDWRFYCHVIVFLSNPNDEHAFASIGSIIEDTRRSGTVAASLASLSPDSLRKLADTKEAIEAWYKQDNPNKLINLGAVDYSPEKAQC